MKKNHNIIKVSGELRHEADKVYLLFDGDNEVWIAKSLGEWDEHSKIETYLRCCKKLHQRSGYFPLRQNN